MTWIRLAPVTFFLVWAALELGDPPVVLGIPHAGRTPRARAALAQDADRELASRGLGTVGRPDPDLAGLLRTLAEALPCVDLQAAGYRAFGAYGPRDAVAAGVVDGEVWLSAMRPASLVVTLLEGLDALPGAPGISANIRVEQYLAACAEGERDGLAGFVDTLRHAGLRQAEITVLVRAVTRRDDGGWFGCTGRGGHRPEPLAWVDTPEGRYAVRRAGDWVTVTPLDPALFRAMAESLVDAVSRR